MTNRSSDQTHRNSVLGIQPRPMRVARRGFEVPVMRETLLLIELEAQEFCVDLGALSQLILSDLGATLQVLRLAGREYGHAQGSPVRVEDCVAAMGVQACIDVLTPGPAVPGPRSAAVAALWGHSMAIGRHSKHIAEQTADVCADQAYLVGLCHSIGSLPRLLGGGANTSGGLDRCSIALGLVNEWSLPKCVMEYFVDIQSGGPRSPWPKIVQAAHRQLGELPGEYAFNDMRPQQLLWVV